MIDIVIFISSARENLIDGIVNKHFLLTEKIKANNLNNFIVNNGNALSHAKHLIIDLTSINDNNDEIIASINMLKRVYGDTRIIALADSDKFREQNRDLLRRIFEKGVYDIITDNTEAELEKCILYGKSAEETEEFFVPRPDLSETEKRKELANANIAAEQKILQEKQAQEEQERQEQIRKREVILPDKSFRKFKPYISVSVCGAEPHIGATHNALLIAKFLIDIGFKACYLEANENQKIFYLKSLYPQNSNFNERKSLLQCFGVPLYSGFSISNVMAENYDFYVFDLGVLTDVKLTSFLTKDLRIIVSGAKAWELNALSEAIKLIGTKNTVNFFLNYSIEGEENRLYNFMDSLRSFTFFPEHVPHPFKGGVNLQIYKTVFREYILQEEKTVISDKRKKGLFKIF